MRATTTRTGSRSRRSNAVVKAAVGSALLAALIAAPAYASATPNFYGNARTSTAAVPSDPGGSTWLQTDPVDFSHHLNGASAAYEHISEVPTLTIPFPGVWEISYNARSYVDTGATRGEAYAGTALFNNGALISESAAIAGFNASNHASQATAGQTFLHKFKAGDKVTLRAFRYGAGAVNAAILSNAGGRTGIMAHWVSPGF